MKKNYPYFGVLFQQRESGPKSVLFLAPAEEISDWGGVPRKSAAFLKGFQRAIEKDHVKDITEFFDKDANMSPTAVVVAFKPDRLKITELPIPSKGPKPSSMIGKPVLINVELDDCQTETIEALAGKVANALKKEWGAPDDDDSTENSAEPNEPDETNLDEAEGLEQELSLGVSHLKSFLDNLKSKQWVAEQKKEDEVKFRTLLADLLKPAMIVDGQHRTEGAADLEQEIAFPVVGLVDADWREDVFHFVVINQKARPIKPEFLSAIISSSLSNKDIEKLKSRLEQAGIDLVDTRIIDSLHTETNSPFRQMIDFKISGAEGKLKYAGMLQLAKRFRRLSTHNSETKFSTFFRSVFKDACKGKTYADKRARWMDEIWFKYFCHFWCTIRERICDDTAGYASLWQPGTNLMKVVTLQELQNLFLQWLFDRMEVVTERSFQKLVEIFIKNLKAKFFADKWALPSLQSGTGREYLREALNNAVKNPNYRYDDALFKGIQA